MMYKEISNMAKRGRMIEKSRRRKNTCENLQQLPFQKLKIPYAAVDVVSRDEVEAIHEASLDVLETIGINFLLKEAREILRGAGATVKNDENRCILIEIYWKR